MSSAYADIESQSETWRHKFTPTYYVTTNQTDATDLNLRANHLTHVIWVGHYWRGNEFEQTRIGYEYTSQFSFIQLVPSLQMATHGFVGGSINTQIGESIYAVLGLGRTNAQDYYNLNFDPNDSLLYGVGTKLLPKSNLSVFTVMDNRLHTDQVVTHLVWKFTPDIHQRLTVDWSRKQGRATVNDDSVFGDALSVTYDYGDVFLRIAQDHKVNFSTEDQTRLSVGIRY
ncbi:MAG: hypothetical protein WCI39_06175 [Gallionellaceae bacterium]